MVLLRRVLARSAIEMTADRGFGRRVVRLAIISAVALGAIRGVAHAVGKASPAIDYLLIAGWVLMPAVLLASLRRPRLRYALVLPASLITIALAALSATALSRSGAVAAGWIVLTGNVLVGDTLGVWFWFRLLPVPPALRQPFSPGRRTLIQMHVVLVVVGFLLVVAVSRGLPRSAAN
jgi:hypothetical protein